MKLQADIKKMRHKKRKKCFDTFLGFTYLWSENCVAVRGHSSMIFVCILLKRECMASSAIFSKCLLVSRKQNHKV